MPSAKASHRAMRSSSGTPSASSERRYAATTLPSSRANVSHRSTAAGLGISGRPPSEGSVGENAQEEGFLGVTLKNRDEFMLPLAEEASLVAAWMGGRTFWSGPGFYGSYVHLKLAEVAAVQRCTAASIAAHDDDRRRNELTA